MADDPKAWVSLISSVLAVGSAVYATIAGRQTARMTATLETEQAEKIVQREAQGNIARFRDPLMHASYDLQSRLFNILNKDFLGRYHAAGTVREQTYAVENTVFLVAQFLGWTEALRQGLQFLELGNDHQTRSLRALQDHIYTQLQRDDIGPAFRLFAGEQRAIGELMVLQEAGTWRCVGFAEFTNSRSPFIDQWLDPLRADLMAMSQDVQISRERLRLLQHALIDLLTFLDPGFVRFPASRRMKV